MTSTVLAPSIQTEFKHKANIRKTICKAVKTRESVDHDLDRFSSKHSNRVQIEGNTQIDDSKQCSSHSNTKQTSANYLQSNNSSKERESVEDQVHRRAIIVVVYRGRGCPKTTNYIRKPKFRTHLLSKYPQTIC